MTTTIPVEILLAAGLVPVDLNNRFITHDQPQGLVERAEGLGMPRTLCAWIKGMYAWCLDHPELETIVAVTQGDCSNTHALGELLGMAGRRVIPFEFPYLRDRETLLQNMNRLAAEFGCDLARAEEVRQQLAALRQDLQILDHLTWQDGKVSGAENHLWLVSSSDFNGDPARFHAELTAFLEQARQRPARDQGPRIGVLGVPPIFSDLYDVLEDMGALVVFNEVQRQFAMPHGLGADCDLASQYLRYTYPYDIFGRIEDIKRQIRTRGIHGLVHYTQTFCYRQVQDIALRRLLDVPILSLEGDNAGPLDGRTRLRLEAFLECLA